MIRRRAALAALGAGVVTVFSGANGGAATDPPQFFRVPPADNTQEMTRFMAPRSGLPWSSGAYAEHSSSKVASFEAGRGRKIDSVAVFTSRQSTSAGLNAWWLDGAKSVTNDGGTLLLAIPLWNEDQTVNSDATAFFDGIGSILVNAGIASRTIVRLGWEMNLPSWPHRVTSSNRTAWVAKFKYAVDRLRAKAPGVKIAFNPNGGNDQTGVSTIGLANELAAYIDIAGPDQYNWYPVVNDEAAWQSMYSSGASSLKAWEDWCRANRKGYTVPEWGGYPGNSGGAGSNGAFWAQKMIGRFAALAAEGIPVYEAYFNEAASYIANSLYNPQQMPALAAAYKSALDYSASGTTGGSTGGGTSTGGGAVVASLITATGKAADGTATLTYDVTGGTDGATGIRVARDGVDTGGYGVYFEDRGLTDGSIVFDKLVNGTAYTLTATLLPTSLGKSTRVTVTPSATPAGPVVDRSAVDAEINAARAALDEASDRLDAALAAPVTTS